jgi:nitrogen regulatory protein P-II 1
MKKIEAIIKPFKLDDERPHRDVPRGEYTVEFPPKMKIEIVVADGVADKVVALITAAAKTGSIGDGKVFVEPLEEAVRIRSGERGDNAVSMRQLLDEAANGEHGESTL